jgi:hypothetical protein
MNMTSLASLLLLIPLALAGPEDAEQPDKGVQPFNVGEDYVVLSFSKLQPGQGNWAAASDVIIDSEGFAWLKADAKVYSQKVAATVHPGEKLLMVTRGAKGLGVILPAGTKPGDYLWEPVVRPKGSLDYPCITWEIETPPQKKVKTDGKGDGSIFFGKVKGGQS